MKAVWLVLGLFAAHFFITAIAYPAFDGDLSWQAWLGNIILSAHQIPATLGRETFTAFGAPWISQEWAFSIGAALGHSPGRFPVFAGVVALCALAALFLAVVRAQRRGASRTAAAIVVAFAGMATFQSFGVRAQVVAWPLLALFLLLLDIEGPWIWLTVPVTIVWANLHASAMLAPVLASIAAIGIALEEAQWSPRMTRAIALPFALLASVCVNPFGSELPRYALALLSSPIRHFITEWKPTSWHDPSFLLGALPLLGGACAFIVMARGRRWKDGLMLVAFSWLLFSSARNIALFGIAIAPLAAPPLSAALKRIRPDQNERRRRFAEFALPAIGAVAIAVVAVGLLRADRGPAILPLTALQRLDVMPGRHHLLCEDFAWCGAALASKRTDVFLDGRADPYPVDVWRDYANITELQAGWRRRLDSRGVNAVIARRKAPLTRALSALEDWRSVYRDVSFVLFVRDPHRRFAALY